jgi:hypothetical protein
MKRNLSAVRVGVVIVLCALVGAAAGIAGSAAAPSSKGKKSDSSRRAGPHLGFHRGPPVHAVAVVLNKAGNGFVTVTQDSGKVKSVSGDQLAVTEGVNNVTYKDVTLTIPSGATVLRNGAKAQLSDLKATDFVHVSQSSEGTFVFAADTSFRKSERGRFRDGPRGPGGPRGLGAGGPDGPPPGAPPA